MNESGSSGRRGAAAPLRAARWTEEGKPGRPGPQGIRQGNRLPAACCSSRAIHDKRVIWVVSGTVELREDDRTIGVIRGGTPEARNPLTTKVPREFSARAMDQVEYLAIDSELLDVMITWDQTGTYEVAELQSQFQNTEGDDWMTTLLQSRAMQRIPPANIQAIFLRMQRTPYRAGDVVINQGAEGDYFYCIVSGTLPGHARDTAEQGRHQAGRARRGRHLRRGGADLRGQAQCHGDDADRRRADAPEQGRTSAS